MIANRIALALRAASKAAWPRSVGSDRNRLAGWASTARHKRSGGPPGDRRGDAPRQPLCGYKGYAGLATLAWLKPARRTPVDAVAEVAGRTVLEGEVRDFPGLADGARHGGRGGALPRLQHRDAPTIGAARRGWRFLEDLQRTSAQRDPVLAHRLLASRRDGPHSLVPVDLCPHRPDDLARARQPIRWFTPDLILPSKQRGWERLTGWGDATSKGANAAPQQDNQRRRR